MNWQLNKIQYPVYNLGEGKRIGIWVQGCDLACKGCINQTLWSRKAGKSLPLLDVVNWVISICHEFDGITISGGEPFQQYEPLIAFLYLIKTKTNLSTHCFSGYTMEELSELFPDQLFMRYLDTLVDGRYIEDLHENNNLKGSSNQVIYQFEDGVALKVESPAPLNQQWSIHVSPEDHQIYMSGIPKKNELDSLCNDLAQVGIYKTFL